MGQKNALFKNFFAAILSVVLGCVLLLFGRTIIGTFIGINENFYLKYYYDLVNGEDSDKKTFTSPDSIAIINIQNYRNRLDIAKILDKVYSLNPRFIGLDVFFNQNPDIKKEINTELISVLKKVKNKIVVPCNYSTNENGVIRTDYPFFYNADGLESLVYVSPLAHDFLGYYKYDDSDINNKDPESPILPRMGIEIARCSQIKMQDYSGDFYVNYSKKDLSQIIIDDTLDIRPSNIQDRIVLIGDLSEIKDMTILPFRFGNKKEISGIEDIAYSLISIKKNDNSSRSIGFQDWSKISSILLAIIISFAFCILQRKYNSKKEQYLKEKSIFGFISILLQPFLFFIGEFAIILLCYAITSLTYTIPDLFISMVSIFLVNISYDLTNLIFIKK